MIGQIILMGLISIVFSIVLSLLLLFHVHKHNLSISTHISAIDGMVQNKIKVVDSLDEKFHALKGIADELSDQVKACVNEQDFQADQIKRLQNRQAADKRHTKREREEAEQLAMTGTYLQDDNQLQFPSTAPAPEQPARRPRMFGEMP